MKYCYYCKGHKALSAFYINSNRCKECEQQRKRIHRKNGKELYQEKQRLILQQEGKCAICNEYKILQLDHDHITSLSRGALCVNCNTALGKFKDNPDFLRKALEYLESR